LFRVAMQYGTRNMQQAAIDLCWRATQSVTQMRSLALPPQNDAYFAFLGILVTRNQSEPANELWRALIGMKLANICYCAAFFLASSCRTNGPLPKPFGNVQLRQQTVVAVSVRLGVWSNVEVGNQPNAGRVGRYQPSPDPPLPGDWI
jgi:hypothetical protein